MTEQAELIGPSTSSLPHRLSGPGNDGVDLLWAERMAGTVMVKARRGYRFQGG